MKREELIQGIRVALGVDRGNEVFDWDEIKTAILSLSPVDINVGSKGEGELTADIKQYMTNLLYSAYDKGEECELSSEFDKWVEEQTGLVDEYLNKYSTQPHPSLTAEEWLREKKFTPDLMFSWEWVIRALTEYSALQNHVPDVGNKVEVPSEKRFGINETVSPEQFRKARNAIRKIRDSK